MRGSEKFFARGAVYTRRRWRRWRKERLPTVLYRNRRWLVDEETAVPLFTDHIGADELALYIANKADKAQAERIKRHVAVCETCLGSLKSGLLQLMVSLKQGDIRMGPSEKRVSERVKSGETGYVQSISPLSFERTDIHVADISKGGLGILSERALLPGTIVQVGTASADAWGEVVSCVSSDGKFRIGIKVESSSSPNRDRRSESSRESGSRTSESGCDLIVG